METDLFTERKHAIMQWKQGKSMTTIAENLNRSTGWAHKWITRYKEEGWSGLQDRSRAPKKHGRALPDEIKRAICQTRVDLEIEAETGHGLKYIGGRAVRTRLEKDGVFPLPSVPTIERLISQAGLTKPRQEAEKADVVYPTLKPTRPHQLIQVDIVRLTICMGDSVQLALMLWMLCLVTQQGVLFRKDAPRMQPNFWYRCGKRQAFLNTHKSIMKVALAAAPLTRMF